MKLIRVLLLVVVSLVSTTLGLQDKPTEPLLHVHVIPHSHCDPGWIKTFDEYYEQSVEQILTRMVPELEKHADQTFVWAEISYFSIWFSKQNQETKAKLLKFVAEGRLEFVGGGWVQHDEATASLKDILDQITEGHQFLLEHLHVRPKIGWQIDPFGHSSLTSTIFASLGYDALVIDRVHYEKKLNFRSEKHLEFIWRGSRQLKGASDIMTHVLYDNVGYYYSGFDWSSRRVVHIDKTSITDRADLFVKTLRKRSKSYQTSQQMFLWGGDFAFVEPEGMFGNMTALMNYINFHKEKYQINLFYSTPTRYFTELHTESKQNSVSYPVFVGDFFPYADADDSYWTGFYATRPQFKQEVREVSSLLASADTLYVLAQSLYHNSTLERKLVLDDSLRALNKGRQDVAIMQHHDAITGTHTKKVNRDYMNILFGVRQISQRVFSSLLPLVARKKNDDSPPPELTTHFDIVPLSEGSFTPILFYNSHGWRRKQFLPVRIRTPPEDMHVAVCDGLGNNIISQLMPILNGAEILEGTLNLYILADLPPVGAATYFVSYRKDPLSFSSEDYEVRQFNQPNEIAQSDRTIQNERYRVTVSQETLLIGQITNLAKGITTNAEQDLAKYMPSLSGAYIFRSNGERAEPFRHKFRRATFVHGRYISQVGVSLSGRQSLVSLYSTVAEETADAIEQEWNIDAEPGEEISIRFSTSIDNDGFTAVYNGLEAIPRTNLDPLQPHKNFYPTSSGAAISDDTSVELSVLVSHAVGAASLQKGELELMVHRNLQHDDGRGLDEAVQDSSMSRLKTWISLTSPSISRELSPKLSAKMNSPTVVLLSRARVHPRVWSDKFSWAFCGLLRPFPAHIHLMTLRPLGNDPGKIAVRTAILEEAKNDSPLELGKMLFPLGLRNSLTEKTLSFHSEDLLASRRLAWTAGEVSAFSTLPAEDFFSDSGKKTRSLSRSIRAFTASVASEAIRLRRDVETLHLPVRAKARVADEPATLHSNLMLVVILMVLGLGILKFKKPRLLNPKNWCGFLRRGHRSAGVFGRKEL